MPDAQFPDATPAAPPTDADATAVPANRPTTAEFAFGAPLAPGELGALGPYRLVKQLGKGGMGAVYLAVDTRLDRKLALKVMLPEFAADRDAKDRFIREAKAVAQIGHDNVVTIYEADERNGVPYIAMQFLQGYPLDEFLKKKGAPPLAHCVRIGIEAARGLAAAHELGLVHRDIKPANLWLEAPSGRVKVLDFGLAKPIGSDTELTKSGAVIGTPAYMSPEQARALKVDHRTDIFSLGTVMYRLLTGRNPFAGANVMAVLTALAVDEPTPIRELNPAVPEALAAFVMRMLAKKPEARPQSALDVATGLRAALAQPAAEVSQSVPIVVHALPQPMEVTVAPESAFAHLLDDEPTETGEPEAAPPTEPVAPKRGKGALIAGGALALVVVIGVAIALGTGGKKPDESAKIDPPPAPPPVKKDKEKPPPKVEPKIESNAALYWTAEAKPAEAFALKTQPGGSGAWFSADGARIVTAGDESTAKVWDAHTGAELLTLRGHTARIEAAAFSPDGARVVTASCDGTAKVWDAKSGAELFALKGHTKELEAVAFSPDGARVVTASQDFTAKVWELPAPNPAGGATTVAEKFTFKSHTSGVWSATFGPDGARIATASDDGTAKIWDAKTGTELLTLRGHAGKVRGAAFSPDGARIVTASFDNTGKVWDAKTGTELFALKGHQYVLRSAAFSADGTRIVTASDDLSMRVWDAKTGTQLLALWGHTKWVATAAFSADGARIVTSSADGTAKVWRTADAHRVAAEWVISIGGSVRVNDTNRSAVAELPKDPFRIQVVQLDGCKGVTGNGLELVRRCGPLNGIGFGGSDVTDAALARLAGAELNHLLAENTALGDDSLAVIKTLIDLHDVHFERTRVTDKGLARLAGAKMNGLFLNETGITDDGLKALEALDMRAVFLRGTKVTANGVQKFAKARPNCTIDWDGGTIEPNAKGDRAAAEWVLSAGGVIQVNGMGAQIRAAADLPNGALWLTYVRLLGSKTVTPEGLRLVGACPKVSSVLLGNSNVTDAALQKLAGAPLNLLDLTNTTLDDDALAVVKTFPKLYDLHLANTRFTDKGMAHFAGVRMRGLYLTNTRVGDDGLKHLEALAAIVILDVKGTRVTEAGVKRFAAAQPQCRIEWDGGVIEPSKK